MTPGYPFEVGVRGTAPDDRGARWLWQLPSGKLR
jgi:hypothetical protein